MKKITALILLFLIAGNIQSQEIFSFDDCKRLFDKGEYNSIIPSLIQYSDNAVSLNAKDKYLCYYMLCVGFFKTKNCVNAETAFEFLDNNWYLNDAALSKFRSELHACENKTETATVYIVKEIVKVQGTGQTLGAGIHSKQIFFDGQFLDKSIGSSSTKFLAEASSIDYSNRIVSKDSIIEFQDILNNHFKSDNFILYGDQKKSESSLKVISNELERALSFFCSYYSFTKPANFINVYVLSSSAAVGQFALNNHKVDLAGNTIGYMFPFDNSMTGYLPDNYAGTLKHELMHMLISNNIQPSPPWIDEGLAALYEVSTFREDMLFGLDNWRGKLLRDNWDYVQNRWRGKNSNEPFSIPNIIRNHSWRQTNYTDEQNVSNRIIIDAISRYLFLYLQDMGYLKQYVIAVKDFNITSPEDFYWLELEKLTHKSKYEFDSIFKDWLRARVFAASY